MDFLSMIEDIYSKVNDKEISKDFISDVLNRLKTFTYVVKEDDVYLISFLIKKIKNGIKNICNIKIIPEGMYYVFIDMICGEFLLNKKQSGNLGDINLDLMVKQVQIGDTNVSFALDGVSSKEEKLDLLINKLIDSGKESFKCYRKMSW